MRFFKKILLNVLSNIATLFVTIIFFSFLIFILNKKNIKKKVPNSILVLDFTGKIVESKQDDIYDMIKQKRDINSKILIWEILNKIEQASKDKDIDGILMKINNVEIGFAQIEEIHEKLKKFKKSGKFLISYGESYSQKEYYLASISDNIFLHPVGEIFLNGLCIEISYYKNLLDKLKINVEVFKIGKYKSGPEFLSREKMSEESREQLSALLSNLNENFIKSISIFSKKSEKDVNTMLSNLEIYSPLKAFEKNIISNLGDFYDLKEFIKKKLNKDSSFEIKFIEDIEYKEKNKNSSKNTIALLPLEGEIRPGDSKEGVIGSSSIVSIVKDIKKNKDIKGVVLRINSPGGSAIASEIIWKEINELNKIKPVFVSMSNLAASGGYYISCGGEKIFCYENTITGSIGVYFMKFNIQNLLKSLGITKDKIKTSERSDIFYTNFEKSDEFEKNIYEKKIKEFYMHFLSRVSENRKMTIEEIDKIAQGRVWIGKDAKRLNLVDDIYFLDDIFLSLAKKLNIENDFQIKILINKETNFINEIFNNFFKIKEFLKINFLSLKNNFDIK
jgi:protease-4